MVRLNQARARERRRLAPSLLLGAAFAVAVPAAAHAHFQLQTPVSWWTQDTNGDPEKTGPCGNETVARTMATNMSTTYNFAPGAPRTINITINETIPHPGHYRVAIAQTQQALPADPVVTPTSTDQCASAAVVNPPVMPVLGDNLSVKTTNRTGVQMFSVTVPDGFTCTGCMLQVIEFMSSHGAPCFYHHCATVTIGDGNGGATGSGGASAGSGGRGGAGGGGRGGSTGAGGAPGSGGRGGSTGAGGAAGMSGGGSGGATSAGTGGATTAGTGGAVVAGSGGAAAPGTGGAVATGAGGSAGPAKDAAVDTGIAATGGDAGCACALARQDPTSAALVLLFAGGFAARSLLARRRRRR